MIKIGLAFKHTEEYKNIPDTDQEARSALRYKYTNKIKRLIYLGLINGNDNEVDIESLNEYLAYESNITEKYMSLKEFATVLGIKIMDDTTRALRKSLNKLGSDSPFECIEVGFPINRQTHFISKSSVESFLKDFISLEELKNRYDFTPTMRFQKLKKFGIHPLFLAINKEFITNSEFETLVNEFESKVVIDKL